MYDKLLHLINLRRCIMFINYLNILGPLLIQVDSKFIEVLAFRYEICKHCYLKPKHKHVVFQFRLKLTFLNYTWVVSPLYDMNASPRSLGKSCLSYVCNNTLKEHK